MVTLFGVRRWSRSRTREINSYSCSFMLEVHGTAGSEAGETPGSAELQSETPGSAELQSGRQKRVPGNGSPDVE